MGVQTTAPLLKPEAFEWVTDVAELRVAADFWLRVLQGKRGSFL